MRPLHKAIKTEKASGLHASHLPNMEFDELERVLDEWEEPLFLFEFFSDNEADLNGAFTIEEAIEKTRNEVKKFRKRMLV